MAAFRQLIRRWRQRPRVVSNEAMSASAPWPLLPGALRAEIDLTPESVTGSQRSVRDIAVDAGAVAVALLVGGLTSWSRIAAGPSGLWAVTLAVGGGCCLALPLRRRFPLTVAAVAGAISAVSPAAGGAAFIGLFSVAVHLRMRDAAWIAALGVATGLVSSWVMPVPHVPYTASVVIATLGTAAALGWGRLVRARRQLLISLAERARRIEADRQAQIKEARRLERTRLAREMHDVLAHRISLISLHAGALEFRPDASPEEIARAAGVIRSGTHQMSDDLREIIGLLREESGDDTRTDRAALAGLPELAEEFRRTGAEITLITDAGDLVTVPTMTARTAYRIIQEGLTNATKHAPGAPVTVTVRGTAGDGLAVEVRQPLSPKRQEAAVVPPGSGVGLLGLAERALLAGGTLDHGPTAEVSDGGDYLLRAWLPWEA
jgi:signal transduction histidine kinase